ncbi:MAG: FAD-binding protein [Calditrichaeota bacterium]|nr:FAD-binding protein [Calditrichota bacterium]
MRKSEVEIGGVRFPVYCCNTLVIGSGAAGLNAAVTLVDKGQTDVLIVTDRWGGGTSNNTGSDKQTYYKLSLSGELPDCALDMARDLCQGGSMHGDIALCEAQNSLQAFFHLVSLGVPFPHDRYGAFVGYKTDHDPRQRATSAGPLTSQLMFQALARDVQKKGIPVLDRHQVIALLTKGAGADKQVIGAIALDLDSLETERLGFVLFNAVNIVLATGGPAGIYRASVYPESQLGSTGMALEIGAIAQNLTEWQYGLASIGFRWNVSGTYQQVIPRYISTAQDGSDEQEFLNRYFPSMGALATAIFLKGYQWPFDPRKVRGYGSSLIDILVYQETVRKGRRVFMDFTRNPSGAGLLEDFRFDCLAEEARGYLERSGALLDTPIQRLAKMNQPAIDLYKSHGIDITKEPLEIAVCAQHNNGGLQGNIWWESNVRHLFPVGEVNGSHGVYRPGGSALNAGQVGSLRAATFIAKRYAEEPPADGWFAKDASAQVLAKLECAKRMLVDHNRDAGLRHTARKELQERMSSYGAHIRSSDGVTKAAAEAWEQLERLRTRLGVASPRELPEAFRDLDLCLTHAVYLEAMKEYLAKGGRSRGSYLVLDPVGEPPCAELAEEWRFTLNEQGAFVNEHILEVQLDEAGELHTRWVPVRPIPREDSWFENVWYEFRRDNIVR